MKPRLNQKQTDLLRFLIAHGQVSHRNVDGRVLRALERFGLVERDGVMVSVTQTGADYFQTHVRRRRRVAGSGGSDGSRTGRAAAIREAVGILNLVLPPEVLQKVGDCSVSGAEIIKGLERFAETLARGGL